MGCVAAFLAFLVGMGSGATTTTAFLVLWIDKDKEFPQERRVLVLATCLTECLKDEVTVFELNKQPNMN